MKKKILWIIVILVIIGIVGLKITMGSPALTVETAKVVKGNIDDYVEETGELMLEEETIIYSEASGKITQVTKKAGDTVKAGEIIAKLDNSDLLLQIKALEAQKLGLAAKYEESKKATDEEAIKILNAQVRSAEALYEESKRIMDNNRVLYEAGAVSLDTYKKSITNLAAAEAAMETAKSNLALALKGASGYIRKQYTAQLSELQTKIEQLKLKSMDTIVEAPADGLVMSVQVKEGSTVQAGSKLYEIGGQKGYYIESNILIEDIAGIDIGSSVIIEGEDIGITDTKGTVRKIHPKAESVLSDLGIEQKRVKVEINLDNTVSELRPGYEVTVKVITESKQNTLLIEEKAVFDNQGKYNVFVNEGGLAKLRVVEKGLESDEMVEILNGLKEGEEIVLSPDDTLKEGTKITAK